MKIVLSPILVLFSLTLVAQQTDWVTFSKTESINTIAQEGNFIWVGSSIGAVRIDKTSGAKTYFDLTNSPLPDSYVYKIAVDKNGVKWFGTRSKGCLVKYDDTNWTIFDTSNSPLPGPGYGISGIAVDSSNNVWIVTEYTYGALFKYDGVNWTVYNTSNSGLPSDCISCIVCEGDTIWIGTNKGLAKFDGINWVTYNSSNSTISNNTILDIDYDTYGNIWLLHTNGVEKFDGSTFTVFNNSNTNIQNINNNCMTIDRNNIIWTGCNSYNFSPAVLGGMMSFDGTSWTKYDTTNSAIPDDIVGPVFADDSNNIWFGCAHMGLVGNKKGPAWSFYDPSRSGLGNGHVRQIVFDNYGNPLIGTMDAYKSGTGLVKYDWTSWTPLDYYHDNSWGMTADRLGNLYVKNRDGLKKYDGTNWSTVPGTPDIQFLYGYLSDYLECITTDTSGGIWMDYLDRITSVYDTTWGTWSTFLHEGLAFWNGGTWTTYTNLTAPIPDAYIYDIKVDGKNNIWLGTDQGLIRFDHTNWTIYNTSNSALPTNFIPSFVIDSTGNIWFSNGHYGFYKFDFTSTTNYQHPLFNSYDSYGVLAEDTDGSVWQITLFDLIQFDGKDWATFNGDNSPIIPNVNSLTIDKHGNKWVGTNGGFLIYKKGGVNLSTNSERFKERPISVYPNPFDEAFEMDFGVQLPEAEISIFDLTGRKVYSTHVTNSQKIWIPARNLKSGIYFYQVKSSGKIFASGKIVQD